MTNSDKWTLEHREGEFRAKYQPSYRENLYTRSAQYAGLGNSGGGARVEESHQSVGGVEKCPHVTLKVYFPAGREDLRDTLGTLLRTTVDAFVAEHEHELEA